jgi:hypothetical protein
MADVMEIAKQIITKAYINVMHVQLERLVHLVLYIVAPARKA